jgi:pilus assembly protein CpaE
VVGKSVLVLDENAASRNFLANTFLERQFKVTVAASGREALINAWRDGPDLILFDPVLSDIPVEDFIQKLRNDPRTLQTSLIALSRDPSPALREACLSAGVHEYLVKSAQALPALEETLTRLFGTEKPAESASRDAQKVGLLITFLSAKGGTGTSSLCANLALNIKLVQPEARIVVADLVLPIGSIAPIVGYEGEQNLATVADLPSGQTNIEYFHQNLPEPALWQFQVLPGSPDPQHGNILRGDRINEIVETLRSAYDFVILDIGRSLSRISLPLIQKADLITLIISTDQSTLKLTKTVWDYFQTQGIESQKLYVILNRALGLEGLTKAQAEEILGLPIKTAIPYMGGNFALANNLHQPITTKYPTDTASIILKETAENMIKLARLQRAH